MQLTEKEIERIQEVIMGQLDVKKDQIEPGAKLMGDLGADSLDMVEISMKLEEEFSLSVPDDAEVETVEDLYEVVSRLLHGEER